ncbi:sigma-70 family RNA polymerase sigma factor [uncultured Phascolarctobacterium sp.]|uniref:RNA polymerase sigma factor n=1 Tax=uncultured Phascolarctobacterium sp. TaxID=512296 RepID=UPI00260A9F1C|nr:sigma-70 family RNA polymerase sigma factor [uncultured Phascolarctobacterium sp.]
MKTKQSQQSIYVFRLTPKEVRSLVRAAQKFDQSAIDRLCKAFEPLIYKEAYRKNIVKALGVDALNTAWEIFLEYIYNYRRKSFKELPVLLKINLHYAMNHKAFRNISLAVDASLDAVDENGHKLIEISDRNLCISNLENKKLVENLLAKLSTKQKNVIIATIINGYTLEEYAKCKGIKYSAAYRLRQRALDILRLELEQ